MFVEVQIRDLVFNLDFPIVLILRFEKQFRYITLDSESSFLVETALVESTNMLRSRTHGIDVLRNVEMVF